MLLGTLQWIVIIGISELSQLVVSFSHFGACPREARLELVVRAFGYVKMILHKVISVEFRAMNVKRSSSDFPKLNIDFLKENPDEKEELGHRFPLSVDPVLEFTILVDSDHSRDLLTVAPRRVFLDLRVVPQRPG